MYPLSSVKARNAFMKVPYLPWVADASSLDLILSRKACVASEIAIREALSGSGGFGGAGSPHVPGASHWGCYGPCWFPLPLGG